MFHFQNKKQNWLVDIFGLMIFFLALYTFYLGSYPLFSPDESRYTEVAREMVATGDYITPRVDGVAFLDKPILYYWLQAAAIQVFGVNEWAIRLFPMLLALLSCLMTYTCVRRLFDRKTGLISAIILATSPLFFGGAHYANLDLEVASWITCTLLCIITALQNNVIVERRYMYAAYIFAALAFLTKGLIGLAFPGIITLSWMALTKRWHLFKQLRLVSGLILFSCIVIPWYYLAQQTNPEFLHFFFITQQITRFLSGAVFNNASPFWFYFPIVLIGFFPWTILLFPALINTIKNCIQTRQQYATELFFTLWLVLIFTFFSIPKAKTIGYILPIFPALSIITGRYVAMLWDKRRTTHSFYFAAFACSFACLALAVPHLHLFELATTFSSHLHMIALIFIAGALLSLLLHKHALRSLFYVCVFCNIVFLGTLITGAIHLNQNTAKPLIVELKQIIHPDDEVASYFKFFQDVPLYLGQRITLVANWNAPDIENKDNWVRELWYGMPFQKTDDWLINEDVFWQRWNKSKRMFVFVNENYFDQFKAHTKQYYFVGRHHDIILLCNKPTIMSLAKDPQLV